MDCCDEIAFLAHGATGVAKSLAGIGKAPETVIKERRDICRRCPNRTTNKSQRYAANAGMTTLSMCLRCKCNIALKTRNADEQCPDGLWNAVVPSDTDHTQTDQ